MSRTYKYDKYGHKLRRYNGPSFPDGTPRWWRRIRTTRPKRFKNRRLCRLVIKGTDPDDLIFPVEGCKPWEYWW